MLNNKQKLYTLILLCLGYFIDFYDLTIMSVSYTEVIKELFGITNITKIQQTYLLISSFQTAGIFIGALTFGIIGDKFGRANAIKYSILLYSISTILSIYTHSLPIFILLRTLAYVGLATEFSTSTVLIVEMFSPKNSARGTALLYSFGVLGGMSAIFIGMLSWKAMFFVGGSAGLLIYLGRNFIKEPPSINQLDNSNASIMILITYKYNLTNLVKFTLIILPYFATITSMFMMPNYIIQKLFVGEATKLLLIGFFIGNILSSLVSSLFYKNKKIFLYLSLLIFIITALSFNFVHESFIIVYFIGIGLIGGGYPIIWAQLIAASFDYSVRNTASNVLFAFGRASSIGFNALIGIWIVSPKVFLQNSKILFIITFILAIICISKVKLKNNHL